MAKEEPIEIQGIVTQALPNVMFKVQTESGHEILAQLSGKMRKYFIKVCHSFRALPEHENLYLLVKRRDTCGVEGNSQGY